MSNNTAEPKRWTSETTVKNGVIVTVTRWYTLDNQLSGTTVEASCSCYGQPHRVHSLESCPNRAGSKLV